jgi:pentatricopeptide repeat protein
MGRQQRSVTTTIIMRFPLLLNMCIFLWLMSSILLLLGNNNNILIFNIVVSAFNNNRSLIIFRRTPSSSYFSSSTSSSSTKLFVTSRKDTNDRRIQQRQESFAIKDRVIEQQQENDNLRDKIRELSLSLSSSSYEVDTEEATNALQQMFKLFKNNDVGEKEKLKSNKHRPRVDVIDCNMVINIWSKSASASAAASSAASKSKSSRGKGQNKKQKNKNKNDDKDKDKENKQYPPQQVMNILNGMNYIYKKYNYESIRPDVITYNSIINTFVRTKGTNFNDGPLTIFKMQINDYKEEHNIKSKPDIYTFSSMINACSKCNFRDSDNDNDNDDDENDAAYARAAAAAAVAAETAERYLDLANNWYESGELKERPNMYNYRTVINCWIKASSSKRRERKDDDDDDDDDDCPPQQRAFNILQTMQIKYEQDEQKNNNNNNNNNRNDNAMRRPNTDMYNKVMNAYGEKGDVDGTKKVYNMMTNDYYLQNNTYSKPNIQTYNILIGAWSSYCRRSKSELDSESKSSGDEQLQNDDNGDDDDDDITIDEATIILKEVETIYNEIKKLYKTGYLKEGPNESTYDVLIKCLERYNGTEERIQELKLLLSRKEEKDIKEKKEKRNKKRKKR